VDVNTQEFSTSAADLGEWSISRSGLLPPLVFVLFWLEMRKNTQQFVDNYSET
jgi:hypothetical protein